MYYAYLSTGDKSETKDSIDIWLENIENTNNITTTTTTTTTTKLPSPKLMPFKKQITSGIGSGTIIYSTWNEIEEADGYEIECIETQYFPDSEPYTHNYNTYDTYFSTGGSVGMNIKLHVRAYKFINDYKKIYSDWSDINECELSDFPSQYTGNTSWEKIYTKKIEEISQSEYFNEDTYMWDLCDINLDGTPELFISTGEYRTAELYIYTIYNSECVSIDKGYGNYGIAKVIPSKKMIEFSGGIHGYIYYLYCQLSQYDKTINQIISLSDTSMAEDNTYRGYMVNDEIISKDDYDDIIDYFEHFFSYQVGRSASFALWNTIYKSNTNDTFDQSLVGIFDRDAGDGYGYFDVYGNYYPYAY